MEDFRLQYLHNLAESRLEHRHEQMRRLLQAETALRDTLLSRLESLPEDSAFEGVERLLADVGVDAESDVGLLALVAQELYYRAQQEADGRAAHRLALAEAVSHCLLAGVENLEIEEALKRYTLHLDLLAAIDAIRAGELAKHNPRDPEAALVPLERALARVVMLGRMRAGGLALTSFAASLERVAEAAGAVGVALFTARRWEPMQGLTKALAEVVRQWTGESPWLLALVSLAHAKDLTHSQRAGLMLLLGLAPGSPLSATLSTPSNTATEEES